MTAAPIRWKQMLHTLKMPPAHRRCLTREMWIQPETDREGNLMNDDTDDLTPILDCYNAAAQGMSGILQRWVRSMDAMELQKLEHLMARGVRPGLLLIANGEGMPPAGQIVLMDAAGNLERGAGIDFTAMKVTLN